MTFGPNGVDSPLGLLIRGTIDINPSGPCKQIAPTLEEISNEMTEVEFGVLDIDSEPNSPIRPEFSVRGVPSCFIVKSGSVVGSKVGLTNRQDFISWIKESIA